MGVRLLVKSLHPNRKMCKKNQEKRALSYKRGNTNHNWWLRKVLKRGGPSSYWGGKTSWSCGVWGLTRCSCRQSSKICFSFSTEFLIRPSDHINWEKRVVLATGTMELLPYRDEKKDNHIMSNKKAKVFSPFLVTIILVTIILLLTWWTLTNYGRLWDAGLLCSDS